MLASQRVTESIHTRLGSERVFPLLRRFLVTSVSGKSEGEASGDSNHPLFVLGPSPYMVAAHKGYKIQASLCVSRLPLEFEEPLHVKTWRDYRAEWEERTGNAVELSDDVIFMENAAGQFIETEEQKRRRRTQLEATGDLDVSELDFMLSRERAGSSKVARAMARRREEQAERKRKRGSNTVDEEAEREKERQRALLMREGDIRRLQKRLLFLLVRYGSRWTFPLEDKRMGESVSETLKRLCDDQLGRSFSPFLLSASPCASDKRVARDAPALPARRASLDPVGVAASRGLRGALDTEEAPRGLFGRKIFFYRALHVPGHENVAPPQNSPVSDFVWIPKEEIPAKLSERKWTIIRDALPTDRPALEALRGSQLF
uniref:Ribosomal protein L46 N-terminal domain-containing protein n=1 Tax=Chromera velia CCMP2878 TaxID=1169474 RepID=A0A0G4HP48_9ALVE|eukprot:Cvel_29746.t1-p1 / transcript=Cvel_29746.t1 / gene=Cvel_29746 / organism=Chromera_velia_CCMP2878 / gene_product=hypothetical protein / transcript_product=hypothetical protein / location=Cvel_scaffold4129:3999-6962(-) / protein_length=373 / sequence_SO=supercontig / SO=protein_coding / is_pseudo=false